MAFEWIDEDGDRCRVNDEGEAEIWVVSGDRARWRALSTQHALREAVRREEVYRKALEPFARRFAELHGLVPESWIEVEGQALREACHLMGIELAADPEDAP